MSTPTGRSPGVNGKRVYRFGDVVGGFLRGLDRAQAIADQCSLELASGYAAPGSALDAFSVPNAELRTVDIDLKCAVVGLSRRADGSLSDDSAEGGAADVLALGGGDGEHVAVVDLGDGKPLPSVDVIVDAAVLRELPADVLCTVRLRIEMGKFPVNEVYAEETGPSLAVDPSRTTFDAEGQRAVLIVTVTDAAGSPLAGQQVRLSQRPEGWFELPPGPLVTNADGKATARVVLIVTPAERSVVELVVTTAVATDSTVADLEQRLLLTVETLLPGDVD